MDWKEKLIFVSAQPDVPYFHWQCEVFLNNFIEMGIPKENIHVLFALVNKTTQLSKEAEKLKKYTPNIFGYIDKRDKKHYIPSIKPYLIYEWIKEDKKRGEVFGFKNERRALKFAAGSWKKGQDRREAMKKFRNREE